MQLPAKIGITGAVLSIVGAGFGFGIFPWFLNTQIAKSKGLVPGSETRGYWEKAPIPAEFKVYIFNVTNHLAVHNGDTPVLDEIGPFWYDEWKDKADIIDYEEDDTVTFHMKTTFIFRPELTAPLTGNETVIVPHPALVGMVGATERTKPGVLGMINKAIPLLFNNPETIFLKTTVYDLLFGGNVINCTSKEFSASAICTFLKKDGKDLVKVSDTIFKFSMFGSRNGTPEAGKFQVNRGIIDYKKVGQMVTYNGKNKMSVWKGKPCNNLFGTDSTIFKPFMEPTDDVAAFAPDLCRSIVAKFESFSNYKGISTLRYNATLGDMSAEPSLKCLCPNETWCLKKGVMDLTACTGAPAIVSFPHFYDAHEDYVKAVRGLHPEKEKHGIFLDMEPITGSPINARKRLQFAFPIHPVNKVDITKNLPDVFLPFMWVEEGASLNDEWIAKFDGSLFRVLRIVDAVRWSLTVIGAVIAGGGIGLFYKRKNNLLVSPTTGNKKTDIPNEFLGEKDGQNGLDGGINNFGYM